MEAFHSCIEKVIVLPIDYHLGLNKNVASLFVVLIIHYSRVFNATSVFTSRPFMKSTMDHLGKNMQCSQNRENITSTPSNHFFILNFCQFQAKRIIKMKIPLGKFTRHKRENVAVFVSCNRWLSVWKTFEDVDECLLTDFLMDAPSANSRFFFSTVFCWSKIFNNEKTPEFPALKNVSLATHNQLLRL